MTRKHFEAIAKALRTSKPTAYTYLTQWESDVAALVETFKDLNPKFDEGRFLKACNYDVDNSVHTNKGSGTQVVK